MAKKENIFIIISIIFISFMVIFYGSRLIHFYKISHQEEKLGESLISDVINHKTYDKNVVKENNNLYYKGNAMNNYLYYSNRYYRIIGIENDKVIIVDDDISTILPFNGEFASSDIFKWLNKDDDNTGVYYDSLSNKDILDITKTCLDDSCNNYHESLIGLISRYQYNKANSVNNYLNGGFYWFSDGSYIDNSYNILENNDELYGVKAVLTLKDDTLYFGGTGTYYDPYLVTLEDAQAFNNIEAKIKVGSYISYSDLIWRVTEINDNIKLVLNDTIGEFTFSSLNNKFDVEDKSSIANYLNNDFYNILDKTYLVKGKIKTGSFINSYLDKYNQELDAYVGMIEIGDLFINDVNNYLTLTNTGIKNTIFKVIDGRFYADSYKNSNLIRPVIFLDKDIKVIEGYGTIDNPFKVGEA